MSTSVTLQKTQDCTALPLAKPLDESVWQAWVLKGRAQDERSRVARHCRMGLRSPPSCLRRRRQFAASWRSWLTPNRRDPEGRASCKGRQEKIG